MRYIFFILSALILTACNAQTKEISDITTMPNVVFLLADDLGYGELGCYGQKKIKTPNLDALAKKGMRFTNFYAGNAVCSPSRAVLMTGKKASHNTIRGNSGYSSADDRWLRVSLNKNDKTIAEVLKDKGYQTAFFGKWHLGNADDLSTWAYARGFDYAAQEQWAMRNGQKSFTQDMEYINGLQDSLFYDYKQWESKDQFRTSMAIKQLKKMKKDQPFFLFMSYRAPHGHERIIGNTTMYKDEGWPEVERMHAAKITLLDREVGRLLKELEQMKKLDNTLVIFTSDNGPHHECGHNARFFDSNGILKGAKRDLYEGGIRVPMIAYWKNNIKENTETDYVGGFQDFMPTFQALAKMETAPTTHGLSLLPLFANEQLASQEYLNWEMQLDGAWRPKMLDGGFRQAVRMGEWKGVRYGVESPIALFNLDEDIEEKNDVSQDHIDIVKKMEAIFQQDRSDHENFPYGGVIQDK